MNKYEDIEQKILLIRKALEDRLGPDEQKELQIWLEESETNRDTFRRIQDKKRLSAKLRYRRQQEMETDWRVIRRRTGIGRGRHRVYLRMIRYAAVFVGICLATGIYFYWKSPSPQEQLLARQITDTIRPGFKQAYIELQNGEKIALGNTGKKWIKQVEGMVLKEEKEGLVMVCDDSLPSSVSNVEKSRIVVPRGGEYQLILPDGTKVWLNSDTRLEFPHAFVGGERRVKMSGEAYFEVVKNTAMPFRVEVDGLEVKVLGTSFNIHAYDEAIKTTLVEGAVELKIEGNSYKLSPGYEANVKREQVEIARTDVYEQIAWKEGKFVFREKRLEEVMSILARWYDFEIFYQNAAVKDLHFTGNIPRHATIDEVLIFLERTHLVHFSVVGRTVVVSA